MTDTYINTTVETTAAGVDTFDVQNYGDTLFLASAGSLIALGAQSIGLEMSGIDQFATLDGTVYSAEGDGIQLSGGGGATLILNGEVTGLNSGIDDAENSDVIIVNGDVFGTAGIFLDPNGQNVSVTVNGTVSAEFDGIIAAGNGDIIQVGGSVEGAKAGSGIGIELEEHTQSLDIEAKGVVYGPQDGICVLQSSGDTIKNSGHVSGGSRRVVSGAGLDAGTHKRWRHQWHRVVRFHRSIDPEFGADFHRDGYGRRQSDKSEHGHSDRELRSRAWRFGR